MSLQTVSSEESEKTAVKLLKFGTSSSNGLDAPSKTLNGGSMKYSQDIKTLIGAGIVLFITGQKGNGFALILLLPFLLVYVMYHAVRMIRRPSERRCRGITVAIWFLSFAVAGCMQTYWSAMHRRNADGALQSVLDYKGRTGSYPATLKEAGLDEQRLRDKWQVRYSMKEGRPSLTYPAPVMPLSTKEFDFEKHEWRENAY